MVSVAQAGSDRRQAVRDETRSVVGLFSGPHHGSGTIHDISALGARIEYPTFRPPNDTQLRIQFSSLPGNPVILCEVTRQTETGGFCVQFLDIRAGDVDALLALIPGERVAKPESAPSSPRANRVRMGVRAGVEVGGLWSEGVLHDVSTSGARVEGAQVTPRLGAEVTVSFVVAMDEPVFRARGVVTRRTVTEGFAVQFALVEPKLEQILQSYTSSARIAPGSVSP